MIYSVRDLSKIKLLLINKISEEIDNANINGTIKEVLDKYNIIYNDAEPVIVDINQANILVFGALSGKKDIYKKLVKSYGINPNNVDFVDDYGDLKNFPVETLRNSHKYSDILFGPVPHSQKTMRETKSFLTTIRNNPIEYPNLIELRSNESLKITKTNFEEALLSTRLYNEIIKGNYY